MIETWEIQNSSQLSKVVYDGDSQRLKVTFVKGLVYLYTDVPVQIVDELISAKSTGSYFNKHIARKFQFTKVG